MIEARGLVKKFGNLEVLKGIDISVRKGAVTSIVGPSGAGKTTLLQVLGTLIRPEEGVVRYKKRNVFELNDKALSQFRCENIGFVFQMHRLLPEFSLQENIAMPALIAGTPRHEAMEKARKLLEYMGLENRASHRPSQLSGGECQRGAVARALINKPDVILADEPSGSLDSQNRMELHKLFFDLRDEMDATFLIVTHDENLAADSDTVICMADGIITDTYDTESAGEI